MKPRAVQIFAGSAVVAIVATAVSAQRSVDCQTWIDPGDDAVIRRTDHGADGALNPLGVPPEIIRADLCPWVAFDPSSDPYTGESVDPEGAHLFRLDLTFAGLLNPPGPVGLGGYAFDPFRFGDSPLVGFLDIDVDRTRNSGGELGSAAEARYLANVGRFARRPHGSLGERAATSRADLDDNFWTEPQYERSGADFAVVLCGCFSPVTVELVGDGDTTFEADESWLVFGRFFERAQGYRDASAAFGGSAPGLYDPQVQLRFDHDAVLDETTVTLVWAIDQEGAAALAGEPEQPIDLNVANHASIVEALQDIIDGADAGGISGPAWELVRQWRGKDPSEGIDTSDWEITGLFGMPYATGEATLYAWTDTLGDEFFADMNGDEFIDGLDEVIVRDYVYAADGGPGDADGVINGSVVIGDPGWDFSLFDTTIDDRIDLADLAAYGPLGDFDDNGTVNTQDFLAFLNAWAGREDSADFNLDQRIDTIDFLVFLNAWAQG